jgi:hypothetical protein
LHSSCWPFNFIALVLNSWACVCVVLQGNKVKLSMRFEGRQLQFKEQGKTVMLVRVCGGGMGCDCMMRVAVCNNTPG